jgi:hypothetical protein
MRQVWIPEPMYRLFPWVSMTTGAFFYVFVQGFVSLGLCGMLVGYGLVVELRRAVG